jgi:hypothetical protein
VTTTAVTRVRQIMNRQPAAPEKPAGQEAAAGIAPTSCEQMVATPAPHTKSGTNLT